MIDKNYKWYVLFVRTNHENKVRNILNRLNIESYLPLIKELRYWSDRKKWMERPLFPGYIFLRVSCREFFSVMDNNSVISYVKEGQNPASISEDQISMIRQVEASGNSYVEEQNCLVEGDSIKVIGGPMKGIEGRISRIDKHEYLLIDIHQVSQIIRLKISTEMVAAC